MTEKELIEQFSLFGYHVEKLDGKYSIFDRRFTKRIIEVNSLESLQNYAEDIFIFPIRIESLESTIKAFRQMFSPVTKQEPKQEPEAEEPVTGEEESCKPDPEQEKSTAPVSHVQKETPPVLYSKICKGCGKAFQTPHKQRFYCSEACYPSNKEKKTDPENNACAVIPRIF